MKPVFKKAVTKAHQKELVGLGLTKTKEVTKPKENEQKGRKAVLAPYVKNRFEIRFQHKSKLHKAIVRKDGSILYKGKAYNSPTMAAEVITECAVNGWTAWTYELTPGDWVLLDVLRKK